MATHQSASLMTAWHRAGTKLAGSDGHVFMRTDGDLQAATPLLLLHGFPSSSYDYAAVWARLGRVAPLIALDLLGYGLSDKPIVFGYTVAEQCDVVLEVLGKLHVPAVHLVVHDMSSLIAAEFFARKARGLLKVELKSVVFCNGSPLRQGPSRSGELHLLRRSLFAQTLSRLPSYAFFRRALRSLYAEPDTIGEDETRFAWELLCANDGRARLPVLMASLAERDRFAARYEHALQSVEVPAMVLWGTRDGLDDMGVAERLLLGVKGAKLRVMAGIGHVPQLEAPDVFAHELGSFLVEAGA